MSYHIFSILIGDETFSKWIEVVSVSIEAAKADVIAAYGSVQIIQWNSQ